MMIANSLALGGLIIMLASGLALVFGLRSVMNFGHGGLYMLGAYLGYSVSLLANFWVALVVVPVALAALGIGLEYLVFRPLNKRSHVDVALITFGLAQILGEIILSVYGPAARSATAPQALSGSIRLGGDLYPVYRLFIIGFGLGTCLVLAAWLKWTRSGLHVRAVSQNPAVARLMGVNADRLSLLVVCLSTAFAGIAGVLAGPYISIDPGMGPSAIITCMIVVVVGGLGSIGGAITAAILYGIIEVVGTTLIPDIAVLLPYILLIVVLLWRPQGIGKGRVAQ